MAIIFKILYYKPFIIYKKSDENDWSFDTIIILLGLLSLLILLLNSYFIKLSWIDSIFRITGFGSTFFFAFRVITSFNKTEKIKAKRIGDLQLSNDQIILGNQNIDLDKIDSIDLSIYDFKGKRNYLTINTTRPGLSNGINNYIQINLKSGKSINYNFKQDFDNEFIRTYKNVLIDYLKQGKLSFINLIEVLGIEDYKEIQDFKKTIANNGYRK